MARVLIIAEDAEHAETVATALREQGIDEAIVVPDPTHDLHAQEKLHRLASLGTLAAGAAHEINNLLGFLTVTIGQLASADGVSDRDRKRIADAGDCCRRIEVLARGMTGFARANGHDRTPILIRDVVEEAIHLVGADVKTYADLEVEIASDLPVVRGNAHLLCQVLVNLLINAGHAVEASDDGGRVALSARREGDRVRIDIEDDGTGIAPEHRPRVFEAFFSTKADGAGTGLGLFLCRALVREHGGDLRLESVFGKGTVATVYLPAHRS